MKTHFDIEKIVDSGSIANELDYERALIADRKLRLLAKESLHFKNLRKKLRDLIEVYEGIEWQDADHIDEEKIVESDKLAHIAELERQFIEHRKERIKKELKECNLNQQDLGVLLGHKSKTHMSELMNGIKPFTLKDLVIIHRLLRIEMTILLPTFLSREDQEKIKEAVKQLNKPKVRLSDEDLALC